MPVVALTREGVQIDGQPRWLLAAQLHYFRFPQAEWRRQLELARAGGINTIDTVIPWNLHEPVEGTFHFAEEADLDMFLDLCHELGLYAIVRPGPYICAEWENGGFPAWLTALDGMALRYDNLLFVDATRRWFNTLLPILAERQIDRGGAVILCQIENEHWASGRYGHDTHQQTLAQAALDHGIVVPQYTCMGAMHEWAEFRNGWSGIAEKLTQTRALWPDNPMIVSELWSGWFDNWGASRHNHKTAARLDLTLQQMTAVGASGVSHWMWAGGTNFGPWGGRTVGGDTVFMTTSYDYDAPVTEYGGVTEKFYAARRHHLFLETLGMPLASVLADAQTGGPKVIAPAAVAGRGEAGSAPYRSVRATSSGKWRDFAATFLYNPGNEGQVHQVFLKTPDLHLSVDVEAQSIKPIYANFPLRDTGWTLAAHTGRLLGLWQQQAGATLVVYGTAGEVGDIWLCGAGAVVAGDLPPTVEAAHDGDTVRLHYWLTDRPTVVRLGGASALTVVLLTRERAERWWPAGDGWLCGPDLVIDGKASAHGLAPVYRVDASGTLHLEDTPAPARRPAVAWALRTTRLHVAEQHDTADWQPLAAPESLDRLGALYGYGWYRAQFTADAAGELVLAAPRIADRARVVLNGQDVGWLGIHPHGPQFTATLPVQAGQNDLRLLVDNLGRFNYGSNTGEQKGLLDTLYHGGQQHDISGGWVALWQEAVFAGEALANAKPWAVRPDAADVHLGRFAHQGQSVWLLRSFAAAAGYGYRLHITGDRNPGAVFVNGVAASRFSRHHGGGFQSIDLGPYLMPGTNVIALNIQHYAGLAWRATLLEYDMARPIAAEWSFRAGVTPGKPATEAGMCFHRATFGYAPATDGDGPFRLAVHGLDKGQIWLNGRDVGRYWQIGPQEHYKLPASWMQAENELLLFDETGRQPEMCILRDTGGDHQLS